MVRGITYEGRVRYGHIMRTMTSEQMGMWAGFPNVWGYTDANVMKWDRQPVMKPLHDGMVFDLGGRRVTAYHVPNHTPGSTVFIDDKSRIIFTGDAVNINIGAVGTVSDALRSVLKVKALGSRYDRIYTGHIAYANWIEPLPEDLDTLDDIIENFRSILRGNPTLKVIPNHLNPARSMTVAVHGKAKSAFDPNRLWGPTEAHVIP
jgi:glyoxylase-like metal-dependent hydrolase (beta-lactamase superfamily II)